MIDAAMPRIVLGLCLLMLGSCASTPADKPTPTNWSEWYAYWEDTPYRYGGTSRSGIDCSALVQTAYAQLYGVRLPRTTSEQRKIGVRVSVRQLQTGDLLFFRPGRTPNHVGIYLGNGRFAHASSSRGVTLSALDNRYWLPRLVDARRVLQKRSR